MAKSQNIEYKRASKIIIPKLAKKITKIKEYVNKEFGALSDNLIIHFTNKFVREYAKLSKNKIKHNKD